MMRNDGMFVKYQHIVGETIDTRMNRARYHARPGSHKTGTIATMTSNAHKALFRTARRHIIIDVSSV